MHHRELDIDGYILEIRRNASGREVLHFSSIDTSDWHLGTRHFHAKKTCHMLEHTSSDELFLLGDIVDGERRSRRWRWNLAPAHRQAIGHILRKATQGTRVVYVPGNHDEDIRYQKIICDGREQYHRNLCGKKIMGIEVAEVDFQTDPYDPQGRAIKRSHGDQYDNTVVLGPIGDFMLDAIANMDAGLRVVFRHDFSLAAKVKKRAKKIIYKKWNIHKQIAQDIDDDPSVCAIHSGHEHVSAIDRTLGGKERINTGSCTEDVEFVGRDRNGTKAIFGWHKNYLKITRENGCMRICTWEELGLESFKQPFAQFEDEVMQDADRLIRLIHRTWPPKERAYFKKAAEFARAAQETFFGLPTAKSARYLLHKTLPTQKYRRIRQMARFMLANGEIARTTAYLPLPHPRREERTRASSQNNSVPLMAIAAE